MNSKQLGAKFIREVDAGHSSVQSAIEHFINAGEYAMDAKENPKIDYKSWVEEVCGTTTIQVSKYIRIATHKWQARQLVNEGETESVNGLQKLLPKSSEPPTVVEADVGQLAYVGTTPGATKNTDDWHTPAQFTDAARLVMGSIDLDPFTSVQANRTVGATRILTEADDALLCSWADPSTRTVWMNPPYSKGASSKAVDKFLEEFDYGSFDQAIVLMNASTDVAWFDRMWNTLDSYAFTRGRIAFESVGGKKKSGNTKGQVFFYFGRRVKTFEKVFGEFCNTPPKGNI